MTKLHLQQTFSHEFQPPQLFLSDHPHCEDAEHFFREFSAGKTYHFFGEKIRSTTRGNVNGGKLTFFRWSSGTKSAGFYIFFPLLKTTFSSRRPLGSHAWSCPFFLSWALLTAPTTSNSCCEEKPVAHRCSAPPLPWWILPFRGSWCGFFALINIHLNFINLSWTN